MNKKALVIVNPSSGKEKAKEYEETALKILQRLYDSVEVKETRKEGDAMDFASSAKQEKASLVVALGGDGTVHEVVNGLSGDGVKPMLGIIPLGTVNDLARALGIPLDPEEAIRSLETAEAVSIDIGKVGERYFASGMALGKIPESIHEVTPEEKSKLGPLAYLLAGFKKLVEHEKIHLKIESKEEVFQGELTALVGSLSGSLGGFQNLIPHAELSDGLLHVLLVEDMGFMDSLKLLPEVLAGEVLSSDHLTYFTTRKLKVTPLRGQRYESDLDGEKGPTVPFTVEVLRGHLKVLAPK